MGYATYSAGDCNNINVSGAVTKHALQGMALDGNNNLWVSESANGGVLQIPESQRDGEPRAGD